MINIISKAVVSKKITGPGKVVYNLMKGLDKIGYPYVVNKRLDACKRLWIQDDVTALKYIQKLPKDVNVIIGPNLYVLPRHIPKDLELGRAVLLEPSQWTKNFWLHFGFDDCPIDVWPVGIDTDDFLPKSSVQSCKDKVLVYFKQRYKSELKHVIDTLDSKGIAYELVSYGNYDEQTYKNLLQTSKYIVWVGRQESQGIALQEALAMDVPILVWDVTTVGHWDCDKKSVNLFNDQEADYADVSSAAYFDESCGLKVLDGKLLSITIDKMEISYQHFEPRKFILQNLSLERQASKFVELYDKHFGLSKKQGFEENILRKGRWRNARLYYKFFQFLKDIIKKFI